MSASSLEAAIHDFGPHDSRLQRPDRRSGDARGGESPPHRDGRALRLRRRRGFSGGDRRVRRDRAERGRTPAGDRRAHGARRDERSDPAIVPATRADRRRDWDWSWDRRRRGGCEEPRESRVRRHRDGSCDAWARSPHCSDSSHACWRATCRRGPPPASIRWKRCDRSSREGGSANEPLHDNRLRGRMPRSAGDTWRSC